MIILCYIKDWLMSSGVKLPDYFLINWRNPDLRNFTFRINLIIVTIDIVIQSNYENYLCKRASKIYHIQFLYCLAHVM